MLRRVLLLGLVVLLVLSLGHALGHVPGAACGLCLVWAGGLLLAAGPRVAGILGPARVCWLELVSWHRPAVVVRGIGCRAPPLSRG